jgi:hypothetical protein
MGDVANYKRRKPRTKVRCTFCTDSRYGNAKESVKAKFREDRKLREM